MQLRQYPCGFGYRLAALLPELAEGVRGFRSPKESCLQTKRQIRARLCIMQDEFIYKDHGGASAVQLLEVMKTDGDLWADADMPSVCRYLRGCKSLLVPESFREVIGLD